MIEQLTMLLGIPLGPLLLLGMMGRDGNTPDWGGPMQDLKNSTNFILGLAQALAAPVEALTRVPGSVGDRHFSGKCLLGMFLMPAIIVMTGGRGAYDGYCAIGAIIVTAAALADHRLQRSKQQKRGYYVHSRCVGIPRFQGEAVVVSLLGIPCGILSIGLMTYMMLAGLSLAISKSAMRAEYAARFRSQRDALYEQQMMADEMRQFRGY